MDRSPSTEENDMAQPRDVGGEDQPCHWFVDGRTRVTLL